MVSDGMAFSGMPWWHLNSHEAHTSVVNGHCESHESTLYVFSVKVVIPGHVHKGQGEEKVRCFKGLKVVLNGRLKHWLWAAQCGKYDPAEISRSWLIMSCLCHPKHAFVSLPRRFSPVFSYDCFRLWLSRPLHKGAPQTHPELITLMQTHTYTHSKSPSLPPAMVGMSFFTYHTW